MKLVLLIAAPLLAGAGSAATAQPAPSTHEQHQAKPGDDRCCCEDKMREMMKGMMEEMMQKHQGGMMMQMPPKDAPKPDKPLGQ